VKAVKALRAEITDFIKPRLEQGLDGLQEFKEGEIKPLLVHISLLAIALKNGTDWKDFYTEDKNVYSV
jgi:hypothetical protein